MLGVLMLLSTVTPRQARSNVEAWFNYFGIEEVPAWLASKDTDSWVFWVAFVGFCVWAIHLYVRTNLRNGKLSIIVCEGEPWVQETGTNPSPAAYAGRSLYTYRIALVNSDDSTVRNVEVKLTSFEKKPENFDAIGRHLRLRDDRAGTTNINVYPTKDPHCKDATFIDVFRCGIDKEHSFLNVTSLPEEMHCHIPLDTYDVKIMATSESGEMAVADMMFISRPDHIPEFRLLKMQSFPGR